MKILDIYGNLVTECDSPKEALESAIRKVGYLLVHNGQFKNCNLANKSIRRAMFDSCIFTECNFSGSDINKTSLNDSTFRECNFNKTNLENTSMKGCSFKNCTFLDTTFPDFQIPQGQDLLGYKKVRYGTKGKIVTLLIPKQAKRTACLISRKCRAEYAIVLKGAGRPCRSSFNWNFIYKNGETVKPRYPYNPDPTQECTSGIHFFITREEAEDYPI
jgi:hypothetical protein